MDDFSGNWAGSGSQQQQSNANLQLARDTAKAESDALRVAVMTADHAKVISNYERRFDRKTEQGGIYDVSSHQYPEDLFGADNTYGSNCIVFYINVQKDSQINVNGEANKDSDTVGDDISSKNAGLQPNLKTQKTETGGQLLQWASLAKQSATDTMSMTTGNLAKGLKGGAILSEIHNIVSQAGSATRATKRLASVIALHTPNAISTSYEASWEGEDTAKAQMAALRWGGTTTDIIKTVAKVGVLQMGEAGTMIGGQLGQAANSKKEMMFKGIGFRSFTFDYKFAPRSQQELILTENIIKMFKFHMHPEYVKNSGNYLFLYPSEFDILYYNNGNENKHLPRYTSCALTSVNVQYTPNAYFTAFGKDDARGAPTEINMTLQFKELAQLTKENIANGY